MPRHVRGSFFAEYVRMLRRRKDIDWRALLPPEDLCFLEQRIDPCGWYPMTTFENLGLAILTRIEGATFNAVRMWGHFSAGQFAHDHPELVAAGHPLETMMRLRVLRSTLFDFPAFDITMLVEGQAYVVMNYDMRAAAEEAASYQTLGFCEGVLSLAGASALRGSFIERSWAGDAKTRLILEWSSGS